MKFSKLAAAITLGLAFSAANAAVANTTFVVKIAITGTCNVTTFTPVNAARDVDFGTQVASATNAALQATNDAATKLSVSCSKNHPVTLGLTPSNANATGAGSMSNGTDTIAYQLRKPTAAFAPAYTVNWGTTGADAFAFQGAGLTTPTLIPVQATIAANTLDVSAGNYTDTVTATLTY